MSKNNYWFAAIAAMVMGLGMASGVRADTILATYDGSSGNLSAKAVFSTDGTDLFLTLTNNASAATANNGSILTAIFMDGVSFNATGATLPTGSNAWLSDGSTWTKLTTVSDVGREWAQKSSFSDGSHTWSYGLSSTGLDVFGPGDALGTVVLPGGSTTPPDGPPWGIVSAATITSANAANFGAKGNQTPLVADSVRFDLGSGNSLGTITSLVFFYGTDFGETPTVPGIPHTVVPLPQAAWLGIVLVGGIVGARKLRSRRNAQLA